jgi:hypothetical protein
MPIVNGGLVPFPYFRPGAFDIAAITNAIIPTVTTTTDNNYTNGQWVRLYIPPEFGMTQANFLKGIINVTSATTFTISIDTTSFDPFIIPSADPLIAITPAQCVSIGEVASTLQGAFRNILMPLF